ncbi:MAG: hypothetical protein IJI46_04565 [Erysipelotrichaceae bacterium]|nr:hypothetical protein [Erysipelotrichaceae bacterium]
MFFVIAILLQLFVCTKTVMAIRDMAGSYHALIEASLEEGLTGTIVYDDGLYAMLGYGIEIPKEDPAKENTLNEFLTSSLTKLEKRAYATQVVYTLMVSLCLALFIHETRGKTLIKQVIAVIGVYGLFVIFYLLALMLNGVPICGVSLDCLLTIFVSLLSIVAGGCALDLLFRIGRFKKLIALIVIPLGFILFTFSSVFEAGLYSDKYRLSFSYLSEVIPEEKMDEAIYDEEKDAVIFEGKEYQAMAEEEPDHLKGLSYAGAMAFEILYPYSGVGLELIAQSLEKQIPLWALLIYVIKAALWLLVVRKKNTA